MILHNVFSYHNQIPLMDLYIYEQVSWSIDIIDTTNMYTATYADK